MILLREGFPVNVLNPLKAVPRSAPSSAQPPTRLPSSWTYHDPNGAWGEYVFRPEAVLSPDGTWMMVEGVAVDIATLTRHATLMPAGTHDPNPVMFPLGPKQLLVKVYDSTYHTIAAVVCDLPAGGWQKVPVPFFGPIW